MFGDRYDLRMRVLPLRVGAPEAPEWTAFQVYDGPDAGAVVHSVPLDAENGTALFVDFGIVWLTHPRPT
jgi:hypothetical protein